MYFFKTPATPLFRVRFSYRSVYGHFFRQSECKTIAVAVQNTSAEDLDLYLDNRIISLRGRKIHEEEYHIFVPAGQTTESAFAFCTEELGYYDLFCTCKSPEVWITERIGIGVIRDEDPLFREDSPFGLCANFWYPDRQLPVFRRMGAKMLRVPPMEPKHLDGAMEQEGLLAMCQQVGGRQGDLDNRFAPPEDNSSYWYTKQNPVVRLQEHGNECWEEHNLTLLAEWTKISNLAKMKANPRGFYSSSGIAGSDVGRFAHFFRQGIRPYISYIGIHPYTFPKAPELDNGFWSFQGLRELAALNNQYDPLPVVASEQGYPAMDDQLTCEAYSPEDMVTKEAQADYLVRKYVLLLSYGVSRILWFNGPWYNGFGILERDGMAPWPAAVAFCEMTRRLEGARYSGDLKLGDGVWCKIFERDGKALAVAWHPLLRSRSWRPELNYTLDFQHRESDGVGLAPIECLFPFAKDETAVTDIYGGGVNFEREGKALRLFLGESPVYITGLDAGVLAEAAKNDCTLFPPMREREAPPPPPIILGIQDKEPVRGAYYTAEIFPGQTRTLLVRVHNFSDTLLNDEVVLCLPDGFTSAQTRRVVRAVPGETVTLEFSVRCGAAEAAGVREIGASLAGGAGLPVMQYYRVVCPFSLAPIRAAITDIDKLTLRCFNVQETTETLSLRCTVEGLEVLDGTLTMAPGEEGNLALPAVRTAGPIGTQCRVEVRTGEGAAAYTLPVPLYCVSRTADRDLHSAQPFLIAGACTQGSVLTERTGPELSGEAKPDPTVLATARIGIVGEQLVVLVDVCDDDLVFVQNTRRNNIDCDGVWFELYGEEGNRPQFRFCMTPADPSGRAGNATVREFSSDIPWNEPYSDFDVSTLDFHAAVWLEADGIHEKGYTLHLGIPLTTVGLTGREDTLHAGFRVIDMDSGDWPQFYDTGKLTFSIGS